MIASTYSGVSIFLLNDRPNGPMKATVEMLRVDAQSLSKREARRGLSATLRFAEFSYTALAYDADSRLLLSAQRDLQNQPVAMPFWPGEVYWADRGTAPFTGGLKIAYKADWSQWEIYESVEPGWVAAGDFFAPVLYGRLDRSRAAFASAMCADFEVTFAEASKADWAIAPAAASFTAGPQPAAYGTAPRLWPFDVNFTMVIQDSQVDVIREQIGFSRLPSETLYPQTNQRRQDCQFTLTTQAQIAQALEFFRQHAGGLAYWAASWVMSAKLTADIASPDTVLTVADTTAVKVGDYIALIKAGAIAVARKVTAKTSTTITVNAAIGTALSKSDVFVGALLLVAFDVPRMKVEWDNPQVADVRMPVTERAEEYVPAADETLGTTLGQLPTKAYLYEFRRPLQDAYMLTMDGSGDNVNMTGITLGASATFCFWAKSSAYANTVAFTINGDGFAVGPNLSFTGGLIQLYADGLFSFGVGYPDSNWHFFAVVIDASGGGASRLYIDGVLVGTCAYKNPTATAAQIRIGDVEAGGLGFNGSMRGASLWNEAKTAAQIVALMASPPVGNEANIKGWWPLDEGIGGTAYDFSTGGHNGTINGNPVWAALNDSYYWRFNGYERSLTLSGVSYGDRPIEHGDIKESIFLERNEVVIKADLFSDNPMVDMAMGITNLPLYLKITQVDVSGGTASNPVVLVNGEFARVYVRGRIITGKLIPGGLALDRKIPIFRLQPTCNYAVYSPPCTLNKLDWKFTAKVSAYTADETRKLDLTNLTRLSGSAPTFFTEWFSNGWIGWRFGKDIVLMPILTSTAPSGGALSVTLDRDPSPLPAANERIFLYPGCDQKRVTCKAYNAGTNPLGKFNNDLNFGGHDSIPPTNPVFAPPVQGVTGGKK